MLNYLDEEYRMHADYIRHQIKVEYYREHSQKKNRKSTKGKGYCAMCKLYIHSKLKFHRGKAGHKVYLKHLIVL